MRGIANGPASDARKVVEIVPGLLPVGSNFPSIGVITDANPEIPPGKSRLALGNRSG
jgi:hypothetical protein